MGSVSEFASTPEGAKLVEDLKAVLDSIPDISARRITATNWTSCFEGRHSTEAPNCPGCQGLRKKEIVQERSYYLACPDCGHLFDERLEPREGRAV
jgi:hypothetical protein